MTAEARTAPNPRPFRAANLTLIGAALPFLAGAAFPGSLVNGSGPVLCPFREVTGLPCPLCGATRAFIAVGHGDAAWSRFNGYWILISLAAFGLSALALLVAAAGNHQPIAMISSAHARVRTSPRAALAALAVLAVPGWLWALVQRSVITS